MSSPLNTIPENAIPQMGPLPQVLPLRPAIEMRSNLVPAVRPKAPMTRAEWVNAFWADISGQLRRLSVISSDLFDGLLLRRETAVGSFLLGELRKTYAQLGNNRNFAAVSVLQPVNPMRGMWQLLWTTKRERELRNFHSQIMIDPINNEPHLELDDQPGQLFSRTDFALPPFVQDFGPDPNAEPEDEFDAVMRHIMRDVEGWSWEKK